MSDITIESLQQELVQLKQQREQEQEANADMLVSLRNENEQLQQVVSEKKGASFLGQLREKMSSDEYMSKLKDELDSVRQEAEKWKDIALREEKELSDVNNHLREVRESETEHSEGTSGSTDENMLNALESKIDGYLNEIEERTAELKTVEGKNAALESKVSEQDAELKEIDNEMEELLLEVKQGLEFKAELDSQVNANNKLEKVIDEQQLDLENAHQSQCQVQEELTASKDEIANMKRQYSEIEEELEQKTAAFDAEVLELRRQVTVCEDLNRELEDQNSTFSENLRDVERISGEFQETINGLEQEISGLQGTISDLEERNRVTEEAKSVLSQESESLNQNIGSLKENISDLEEQLQHSEREKLDLERRIGELDEQIEDAQVAYRNSQDNAEQLQVQNAELSESIEQLDGRLSALTQDMEEASRRKEQVKQEFGRFFSHYKAIVQLAQDQEVEIAQLEENIALKSRNDYYQALKQNELIDRFAANKRLIGSLQQQLADLAAAHATEIQETRQEEAQLHHRLADERETAEANFGRLNSDFAAECDKSRALQADLQAATESNAQTAEELQNLLREVKRFESFEAEISVLKGSLEQRDSDLAVLRSEIEVEKERNIAIEEAAEEELHERRQIQASVVAPHLVDAPADSREDALREQLREAQFERELAEEQVEAAMGQIVKMQDVLSALWARLDGGAAGEFREEVTVLLAGRK